MKRRGEPATVLARERVVGAELGEDPDHGAADQVAPLLVIRRGERLLQRLEGGLVLAGVPGLKGALEQVRAGLRAVAVPGAQAGAGGQALGEEVAGQRLEQLQRLLAVAAAQEDAPQLRRCIGVARVECQRLAQRLLVPGGDQLVGGGGDELVEKGLDPGRRESRP